MALLPENVVPVIAPVPLELAATKIGFPQVGFNRIEQSVVALNLYESLASNVLGFTPKGKVHIFQTIEPVAPKVGSKITVFGVGRGVNNIVPTALPGT